MKQALRYANNEKLLNYPDWKERVHKACIRACEGDQTRTGIIMLYLSRWSSPLMSSQLRNLCQSFARSSYSLLRGYHIEPCPRPADNAIIGLTDRFIPCGGVTASDQTPHLFGWLFWECGRIRTCDALLGLLLIRATKLKPSSSGIERGPDYGLTLLLRQTYNFSALPLCHALLVVYSFLI